MRWFLPLLLTLGVALPALAEVADHLIISEVMIKTRNPVSNFGSPFIKIVNPTVNAVDMSDYYLTDGTFGTSAIYYNIVLTDPGVSNPGGGNGGDFHGRFPDGFVLAAGDSLVIALNGDTEYGEAYGLIPDFELYEDDDAPDDIPELVEAFPGSINAGLLGDNDPALSDVAESLILYVWDGATDLVADVDYMMWGSNTGVRIDKTDVTVGSGTYLSDTAVGNQFPVAGTGHGWAESWQRVNADEGTENLSGGNGLTGHDETGENLNTTWSELLGHNPPASPDALYPSAPVVTDLGFTPPNPYTDQTVEVSAEIVTFGSLTAVDFHYSVDGEAPATLTGTLGDGDTWTAILPGQVEDAEVAWWVTATNSGGGTVSAPIEAPRYFVGWTVREEPAAGEGPVKLLITEVSAGVNFYPSYSGQEDLAMEFIEIHNPTDEAVDLSNYFLTDAIHYSTSADQLYWQIANGLPSSYAEVGGGDYNDFSSRFPDGYEIDAGQTIVISIAGSSWFESVFGALPDLELYEDDPEPDDIPDMRPLFDNPGSDLPGNSIYTPGRPTSSDGMPRGIPELEEYYGEPVILFHWNEGDDLVTDVDFFAFGSGSTGDFRVSFDKTDVVMGASRYLPDTPITDQDWHVATVTDGTQAYARIRDDDDDEDQIQTGGNGVDGREETSELMSETFEIADFSPGVYYAGTVAAPSLNIELEVEAKTFNPQQGEEFPIRFRVGGSTETKVRIFNLEGQLVYSLLDSRFETIIPGLYTVVYWDGRDAEYQLVRAGMYVVHVESVSTLTGEQAYKTAPVVVSTRLSQ